MNIEVDEEGIPRKRLKKEEHISVIGEPGGKYLGHIALEGGSAVNIRNGILNLYETIDFSAIGCQHRNTWWSNTLN